MVTYNLKYDVTGKITGIYADAALTQLKLSFGYDENGNRITRTDYTGTTPQTTYTVYDASGNPLAIYNNTTQAEVPIYGSERLGTYSPIFNSYAYELRDNVGSVRVVISNTKTSTGQANVFTYNDYYPFGSTARSGGVTYRYEYQGAYADKDPITGFNNFELRMYDGRIGRWLSTDPNAQYYSPYVGMGNNPVNMVDPDGGFAGDPPSENASGVDFGTQIKNDGTTWFSDGKNWTPSMDPVVVTATRTYGSSPWMSYALSQIGTAEFAGSKRNNPSIIAYHATTGGFKDDETPWCSSFVNWSLKQSGNQGTNSARALSFANFGIKLSKPAYGSIAIVSYGGGKGHVGFVAGTNSTGRIVLLGGNQSDMVKFSAFKMHMIYVYPKGYTPSYNLPRIDSNGSTSFSSTR